jgi:energy-coupling factor transporter ATP-binding protein EcfA2
MIERIDIKNYQSLHNISLEMGKFTVIFGDSDVGKSAVYRAIRGLVTAEDGDSFITEGKPKTGVSLLTPTSEVVWIKSRGKSSTYHLYLDGVKTREWNRARSLPLELAKGLMFGQMVVDGDKFYPNFRGQFDPLFMLFESSGKRARLLGSLVSNLLLKGIKIANVERNRVEADIRAMSGLAETLEKKLEVDWSALETKAVAVNKFACIIEKQVSCFKGFA